MASTHKHLRSSTANKRPTTAIAEGQIALNTNSASPGLFFKDSTGASIIKVGPVHVGTTAPNVTPPSGGSSGNSTGEVWLDTSLTPAGVKIWNGSAWVNATPVGSTTVQGLLELATNAETQAGTDTERAVTPAALQSKMSDSAATSSSTTIASSTAVKTAYDLANAALPRSGGTITGNLEIGTTGSLSFEGSTADAFETTIAVTDPTADRTITLPDTTGTVVTTGDSGTVTSTMIANGTIVDADINASAAIAHSKLANITAGSVLLGNASNVPTATALSGDVTVTSSGVTAISSGVIVNADVNASAAIAGTKISPDFGSQNVTTTGTSTAASFIPTSSTVPTNGVYLPAANSVALSTNGTGRLFVDASGNITVGSAARSVNQDLTFSADTGNFVIRLNRGSHAMQVIDSVAATTPLTLDSSGRLGLGTSAVTGTNTRLEVSNDSAEIKVSSTSAFNANFRGIRFGVTGDSVDYSGIRFQPTSGELRTEAGFATWGGFQTFYTNGLERLRITSAGRVGIGTNPAYQLHVSGTTSLIKGDSAGATFGMPGLDLYDSAHLVEVILTPLNAHAALGTYTNHPLAFYTNLSEKARIDTSGRLLIGTSSARSQQGVTTRLQVENTDYDGLSLAVNKNTSDACPVLTLGKSRGSSLNSSTIVQNGDRLGAIYVQGADGTDIESSAACIEVFVDGTPGVNDMPGRLVFSTTADGASSPTVRFTLNRVGDAVFSNTSAVYPTTDNAATIGGSSNRWSAVWAANGTIQTSDQRAKTEIADAQLGSEFIRSLRPVSYKWIDGGQIDTGRRDEDGNYIYESVPGTRTHWGFIAQEVKEAVDNAGVDFGGWVLTDKNDPDSQQALRYDQFIAPLTKALQEAMERIETLEAKVAALEGA